MSWAYWKESSRWTQSNNEERIIVGRTISFTKFLVGFGAVADALIYFTFFTGIYNFRTRELVNMRKVPFLAKFGVSTVAAFAICRRLYSDNVYKPDVYGLALKYRTQFDEEYKKQLLDG